MDRFINATDHPPATKRFRSVAVICSNMVDEELANAPTLAPLEYTVVIIAVPDLQKTYSSIFCAAKNALPLTPHHETAPPPGVEVAAK